MYSHPLGYNWGGGSQKAGGVTSDPWVRVTKELLGGIENILHLPHKKNVGPRRNFSEASKILHLPHKKEVGSPLSPNICTCHTKGARVTSNLSQCHGELLGGIEKIAPATQNGGGVTSDHGPGSRRNFSEDAKILHLPHKKEVGSQRASRWHRKYCTCHTKSVSVTCDSSQQASIRSGDNISEASKLLHLPRKTHGKGHKLSIGSQAIRK